MDETVFERPPAGIGADTGYVELVNPAHTGPEDGPPGPTISAAVCIYEGTTARRNGPLLLSVRTIPIEVPDPDMFELNGVNEIILAAKVAGVSPWEAPSPNEPQHGDPSIFTAWQLAGCLILDLQVGAVTRTLVADLRPGTYQLPPCDRVVVTAAIRSPQNENPQSRIGVQAAVTPGRMSQARPLLYTDAAYSDISVLQQTYVRQYIAPAGASEVRPICETWTQVVANAFTGMPTVEFSVGAMAAGQPVSGPFVPVNALGYYSYVFGRFVQPANLGMYFGAQWRVDP